MVRQVSTMLPEVPTIYETKRPARDPQDPTFHPIRDILDRPTLSQLRKLGMSAVMYAVVITGGIGVAIYSLRFIWTPYQQVLPLRWNSRYVVCSTAVSINILDSN